MPSNPLAGTWKLKSFEVHTEDNKITRPWGTDVSGQVIYTADGYMSGCFMQTERVPFVSDDVMSGSADEFASAMKSYIGYAGTYSVKDNCVIHHVSTSLFPNWTRTDIKRFFTIEGTRLTLTTPPSVFDGMNISAVLLWERLPPREIFAT
jgi:glucuronate isomerase